jgi:hypothetical protein
MIPKNWPVIGRFTCNKSCVFFNLSWLRRKPNEVSANFLNYQVHVKAPYILRAGYTNHYHQHIKPSNFLTASLSGATCAYWWYIHRNSIASCGHKLISQVSFISSWLNASVHSEPTIYIEYIFTVKIE